MHWDTAGKAFFLDDGTKVGDIRGNHITEVELDLDQIRDVTIASLRSAVLDGQQDFPSAKRIKGGIPGPIADRGELTDEKRYRAIMDASLTDIYVTPSNNAGLSTLLLCFTATGEVYADIGITNPLGVTEKTAATVLGELTSTKGYALEHLSFHEPDDLLPTYVAALMRVGDINTTLRDLETLQFVATELLRLPKPELFALSGSAHFKWDLARRLLLYGHTAYLVGQPETSWLEVKSRGYDCGELGQQIELAKDVARFANGDGPGLLVLGYRTKRIDGQDVIQKHCPLPIDQATCERYRSIIDKRVFPPIRGLSVDHVQHDKGASVVITVPEQEDHERPFLVHGAMVDGKHEDSFISIVRRRGEDSIPVSPAAIHAVLAAGRRMLRSEPNQP